MKKSLSWVLPVGVLAVCATVTAHGADAPGKTGATTEGLLKTAKLVYTSPKEGIFRVLVEAKGEISAVIIEEKKAPWKSNSGNDVLYAYVWTEVQSMPAEFKPPQAMLTRLAQLNDNCRFGSIGMSKKPDGSWGVFRNMSCFLKGTDAEQLTDFVYMSHFERLALKKELKGFME